jgi:hypothetical protein
MPNYLQFDQVYIVRLLSQTQRHVFQLELTGNQLEQRAPTQSAPEQIEGRARRATPLSVLIAGETRAFTPWRTKCHLRRRTSQLTRRPVPFLPVSMCLRAGPGHLRPR